MFAKANSHEMKGTKCKALFNKAPIDDHASIESIQWSSTAIELAVWIWEIFERSTTGTTDGLGWMNPEREGTRENLESAEIV